MNNKITSITIGEVSINIAEHILSNNAGDSVTLQPKVIDVLASIADRYPELISRGELIDSVWEGNYLVGEKALTNSIWVLRQSFKKLSPNTELIGTVRKSGYKILLKPQIEYSGFLQNQAQKKQRPKTKIQIISAVFFSISALLAYQLWSIYGTSNKHSKEIVNVTAETGSEVFPSLSPDGKLLAFKWVRPGYSPDLFIKDVSKSAPSYRQITFDDNKETGAVWSKDGSYLYYMRKDPVTLSCDLVSHHLAKSDVKRLASCPYSGFTQLDISPDGSHIAYKGQPESGGKSSVYLLNISEENSLPQRLTCVPHCNYSDRDIAFSPDGKSLAVSRRTDDFHENLVVINIASRKETQLTEELQDINGLSWHPDGERIVFGVQQAEKRHGFAINVNTRELYNLEVNGFSFPRYSDNGTLYYHRKVERFQISSIDFSNFGSPVVLPVLMSSFSHKTPDYSDTANKLVYVSNESGYYELWLANKDGSDRHQLTYLKSQVNYPSWSHDGRFIAFTAPKHRGVGDQLNVIEVSSGEIRKINSAHSSLGRPTWSFDNKRIFSVVYSPDKSEIFSFPLNSNEKTVAITNNQGRLAHSFDSHNIVYSKYNGSLWMKKLDDNDKPTEILTKENFGIKYVWDLANGGIFFYHRDKRRHKINFYDLTSRAFSPVFDFTWLKDDHYGSLSVSTSHSLIFLTVSEYPQADIKLLRHSRLE